MGEGARRADEGSLFKTLKFIIKRKIQIQAFNLSKTLFVSIALVGLTCSLDAQHQGLLCIKP